MTPPEGTRRRLRSNHACLNCRRKKSRCPGEKPACSCCVRLNQSCFYPPVSKPGSIGGQSKDRLAELEEKVNLLLKGNIPTRGRESVLEDAKDLAETRFTQGSQPRDRRDSSYSDPSPPNLAFDDASPQPSSLAVARAVDSYMKYCHRQPVWCFNFEEHGDLESIPEELLCSIIALTARFSHEGEHGQHHADTAKSLIMLRIANGPDLKTASCNKLSASNGLS